MPAERGYELAWPNIIRIDHVYRPRLRLDLDNVEPLQLNTAINRVTRELWREWFERNADLPPYCDVGFVL